MPWSRAMSRSSANLIGLIRMLRTVCLIRVFIVPRIVHYVVVVCQGFNFGDFLAVVLVVV